jgi:chaperonin cofactor prefoldin
MADGDSRKEELHARLEGALAGLGDKVAAAMVEGLEKSELIKKIFEQLGILQERADRLEAELNRIQSGPGEQTTTGQHDEDRQPDFPPIRRVLLRRQPGVPRPGEQDDDRPAANPLVGPPQCSEPGCKRPARSRGLCSAHYQRLRYREKKGIPASQTAPLTPPPMPLPAPSRSATVLYRREGGTKGIFAVLYDDKGRRLLAGLINQVKIDRRDLVERINEMHAGLPGVPLEEEDVLRVVHYHQLGDALRKRESDVICRHLTKQRGSLGKTAQTLKMEVDRLKARIQELGIDDAVARIRTDFRESVLEHGTFQERLDLALTREKYLEDLGIEAEVDASLRRDLEAQLARLAPGGSPEEAARLVREALDLDEERYRRLVKRFGLGAEKPADDPGGPGGAVAENP